MKDNKWKHTVLYSFNQFNEDSGGDGCYPTSGGIRDGAGNLYGTTLEGRLVTCRHRFQDRSVIKCSRTRRTLCVTAFFERSGQDK